MNAFLKFLPLLLKRENITKNKKWFVCLGILFSGYQLFAPNGVGANYGIPSYDTFYKEPRDVLVSRVESARDVQVDAAEEFKTALEKFKDVTQFDGGDLEKTFNRLNSAFNDSEAAANKVNKRVERVVGATNNLLSEWREELEQYNDQSIRQRANKQFDETRLHAEKMIAAMRKAEKKTEPVLAAFKDQVLFVKHNLNMQAISALSQEHQVIESDVAALIVDMEASIAEAESFISSLKK